MYAYFEANDGEYGYQIFEISIFLDLAEFGEDLVKAKACGYYTLRDLVQCGVEFGDYWSIYCLGD